MKSLYKWSHFPCNLFLFFIYVDRFCCWIKCQIAVFGSAVKHWHWKYFGDGETRQFALYYLLNYFVSVNCFPFFVPVFLFQCSSWGPMDYHPRGSPWRLHLLETTKEIIKVTDIFEIWPRDHCVFTKQNVSTSLRRIYTDNLWFYLIFV